MGTVNMGTITLKPLLLVCLPESGLIENPGGLFCADFFQKPDIALSQSAQERGWLRALTTDHRVYCASECESLVLKLNTYDLLIASPLSLNTLAKFALGIRDSFPSEILWQFSTLGKPVLLNETCLPSEADAMNPHLVKVYRRHWQNITGGTIAGFKPENLDVTATRLIRARTAEKHLPLSGSRIFVTREDVIIASESLEPLRLPASAIITDAAREEAINRGVVIIQQ